MVAKSPGEGRLFGTLPNLYVVSAPHIALPAQPNGKKAPYALHLRFASLCALRIAFRRLDTAEAQNP